MPYGFNLRKSVLQRMRSTARLSNLRFVFLTKLPVLGVSPAFRTKRAGRPRSFGLHFSEMRPISMCQTLREKSLGVLPCQIDNRISSAHIHMHEDNAYFR